MILLLYYCKIDCIITTIKCVAINSKKFENFDKNQKFWFLFDKRPKLFSRYNMIITALICSNNHIKPTKINWACESNVRQVNFDFLNFTKNILHSSYVRIWYIKRNLIVYIIFYDIWQKKKVSFCSIAFGGVRRDFFDIFWLFLTFDGSKPSI